MPQIRPTLITVFITVLIIVLKVFDIVFVMTNGALQHRRDRRPLLQRAVHPGRQRDALGDRRHLA